MHVVMFGDQHLDSLGGAQVSMRLQRRFLQRAGHTVTVVAPRMHSRAAVADPSSIDLPSIPITPDREYSMSWPGARTDRWLDAAISTRPPVDVVHVQADFWGAFIGHRFAAHHGHPVVHTMHNRVDVGIAAVVPFPGLALRVLNAWARHALRPAVSGSSAASAETRSRPGSSEDLPRILRNPPDSPSSGARAGADGWSYLRRFAALSRAVTAPSGHFARRLEEHAVVPLTPDAAVDVVWNGIDDDILDAALSARSGEARRPGPPRFVWLGRMSPEKRLLPFLEALAESGVEAEVEVIGGGAQLGAARRLVDRRRPSARVRFAGRLPYAETLRRIASADAVVQTSIGFETQGMTVFEAASLGTPSVVSDPDIAAELGSGFWPVADASPGALAETLRTAASDIAAGSAPVPAPSIGQRFRQSSQTMAMVAVYQRALDGT